MIASEGSTRRPNSRTADDEGVEVRRHRVYGTPFEDGGRDSIPQRKSLAAVRVAPRAARRIRGLGATGALVRVALVADRRRRQRASEVAEARRTEGRVGEARSAGAAAWCVRRELQRLLAPCRDADRGRRPRRARAPDPLQGAPTIGPGPPHVARRRQGPLEPAPPLARWHPRLRVRPADLHRPARRSGTDARLTMPLLR